MSGGQLALAVRLEAFRRLMHPHQAPWWMFGWACEQFGMRSHWWDDADHMEWMAGKAGSWAGDWRRGRR